MNKQYKLKACPFCGEFPAGTINNMYIVCGTEDCPAEFDWIDIAKWQQRPLDDALRARAERAEADLTMAEARCQFLHNENKRLDGLVVERGRMVERLIEAGDKLYSDSEAMKFNPQNQWTWEDLIAEWRKQ